MVSECKEPVAPGVRGLFLVFGYYHVGPRTLDDDLTYMLFVCVFSTMPENQTQIAYSYFVVCSTYSHTDPVFVHTSAPDL